MKKVICNKVYDTETASVVKKNTYGVYGDPTGYEETLFVTPDGFYFMYTNGGSASKYTTEKIERVSKAKAKELI